MHDIQLPVQKLDPKAVIPQYATVGSACFDLFAIEEASIGAHNTSQVLRTGLAFEVPKGWVMKIYSRSGHGFKHGARLANCVGIIDSDYRGEVMVKLSIDVDKYVNGWPVTPSDANKLSIRPGDRIAQAMLERVEIVEFVQVSEVNKTERGNGGFGSTGA